MFGIKRLKERLHKAFDLLLQTIKSLDRRILSLERRIRLLEKEAEEKPKKKK